MNHQINSQKQEYKVGQPGGKKRRQNTRKTQRPGQSHDQQVAKTQAYAHADRHGRSHSTPPEGHGHTDQSHDQHNKRKGRLDIEFHKITGGIVSLKSVTMGKSLELGITHFLIKL